MFKCVEIFSSVGATYASVGALKMDRINRYISSISFDKKKTYLAEGLALLGLGAALDVEFVSFHEKDIRTSPKHKFGSNPDDDDKACDDLVIYRKKYVHFTGQLGHIQ